MFANPLTLIILLLFLLFICTSLLIWFALTLSTPKAVIPAKRKPARGGVQVKEGKHVSRKASEPAVALRGSAALLEDAQAKSLAKIEAERASRLEALKAERAAPIPKPTAPRPPTPKPAPNPAASVPKRAPAPQRKVDTSSDSGEPRLERAKRESPFPSPPRYDPSEKGGPPVRVRPVAKTTAKNSTAKSEPASPNELAKPAPKPKPPQKKRKPDAFEQFIRSKNDDFEL